MRLSTNHFRGRHSGQLVVRAASAAVAVGLILVCSASAEASCGDYVRHRVPCQGPECGGLPDTPMPIHSAPVEPGKWQDEHAVLGTSSKLLITIERISPETALRPRSGFPRRLDRPPNAKAC